MKVITFDIDGVIADGKYIPKEERTASRYANLGLRDNDETIPSKIRRLAESFDIYLLTGRETKYFELTYQWCHKYDISYCLGGIICGAEKEHKAEIAEGLYSAIHFDDDVRVLDHISGVSCNLVDNSDWELNQQDKLYNRVFDWQDIMRICAKLKEK